MPRWVALLLLVGLCAPSVSAQPQDFRPLFQEASEQYGVDWRLLEAVVAAESNGNPRAFRKEPKIRDASYGLMQILETTARDLGFQGPSRQLFEAGVNVSYGARYLQALLDRFGDVRLALAAYNAGPTRVARLQRVHGESFDAIRPRLPRTTRAYVNRVLAYYQTLVDNGL